MTKRRVGPAAALLSLMALASFAAATSAAEVGAGAQYVAMGSSFAAGPGVAERAVGAPPLCAQSSSNYAHLLAAKRGLTLDDVSCSGSVTANILTKPQMGTPPEVEAVGPTTQLVTLTIGGNDVGYLGELARRSCLDDPARTPANWRPLVCRPTALMDVERGFAALPGRLQAVVSAIKARSPQATIVFVDYVTILPAKGACPARSPLTEAQIAGFNTVAARLAAITSDVARSDGSVLIKASSISTGHDMCANDPWVFPYAFPATAQAFGPAA
jgi:hypothetical protein